MLLDPPAGDTGLSRAVSATYTTIIVSRAVIRQKRSTTRSKENPEFVHAKLMLLSTARYSRIGREIADRGEMRN